MRIESSVTAISWIPSEAIQGMPKIPFELGIGHYDEPPPDRLEQGELERLRDADRFREANHLQAWIEVEDGKIVDHGQEGEGLVGSTTFRLGPKDLVFQGVPFETLKPEPEIRDGEALFVQTVGGRAGFPAPRRVKGRPFMRVNSATAWTTLALTIRADGSSDHDLVGASPFPRHWIYDHEGNLVKKAGTVDFKTWYREAHGEHTPWGDEDSEPFVAQAESALERELSRELLQGGAKLPRRKLKQDERLVEQGAQADELYLLLDGVLAAVVDGEEIAQVGPGAILGEGAIVGEGTRNATLRACTPARVAVISPEMVDPAAMETLASGRRREG
jgi:cyclic nucleotide-binding protein